MFRRVASSAVLAAVVACSGASSTELFAPADSSQSATEPDDGADAPSTSPGSPGLAGPSPSGSSNVGGGADAGKDAAEDAAPSNDSSVYCRVKGGPKSCSAGAEVCCRTPGWDDDKPSSECKPAGLLACVGGTSIACDDGADCPGGQVCCGSLTQRGYRDVECRTSCEDFPGGRGIRFCDPKADVDECAEDGDYCAPSQSLPGYFVCHS